MESGRQQAAAPPGAPTEESVDLLQGRLGHHFDDPSLLELALTHRSWCAEHPSEGSNERLEFLGDAVLGQVVTDHLYRRFPERSEGELAKIRAWVVSAASLAEAAEALELGGVLRLGKGEHQGGGRQKRSILADALEAVLGAIYLDAGLAAATDLVLGLLSERIDEAAAGPGGYDHKTQLQELGARLFDELPDYDVAGEGPDHDKQFFATVRLGGAERGRGEGRSKKEAEQAAARDAWDRLMSELGADAAAHGATTTTTTGDRSPDA